MKDLSSQNESGLYSVLRERNVDIETCCSAILSESHECVFVKDNEERYVYVNAMMEKTFGLNAELYLGKTDREIFGDDTVSISSENDADVLFGAGVKKEVLKAVGNSMRTFRLIQFPMYSNTGLIIGAWGLLKDLTEYEKREEMLRESENRFHLLFEHAPLSYQLLDVKGNILDVNSAWRTMVGYSREEVTGKQFIEFVSEDSKKMYISQIKQLQTFGEIYSAEFTLRRKDGECIIVSCDERIGYDKTGDFKQVHCILHNITERKKTEEALRQSEIQLREQKSALEQKNIALQEVLAQIESDKRRRQEQIKANIEKLILPTLHKIGTNNTIQDCAYVEIIDSNLKQLTSSIGLKMTEPENRLSPREMEICNLIKNGYTNKEIAKLLKRSELSIATHRKNIRRKMGISNKPVNLAMYLDSL